MTQMDGILEEASGVIGEISALAGSVPSKARCGALLDACSIAQSEIRSVDFLSYGQRVNNGLLNMTDRNAYISDKFIQAMKQLQQANSTTLSNYNWMKSEHVTYEFLDKVVDISEKLGVSPDDLMAVMAFESGFDPECKNSIGASGLIQFTDISLEQINNTTGKSYTIEDIRNMNALEQLDVVYLHCKEMEI